MLAKLGQSLGSFLWIWIVSRGPKTLEMFRDFHLSSKIQIMTYQTSPTFLETPWLLPHFQPGFPDPPFNFVCSHTMPRNFLWPKLARASFCCLQPENPEMPFYTLSISNAEMLNNFSQGCSTSKRVVTSRLLIQCSFYFATKIKMIIQQFFKIELEFPMLKCL